jgi:hypothetical protein
MHLAPVVLDFPVLHAGKAYQWQLLNETVHPHVNLALALVGVCEVGGGRPDKLITARGELGLCEPRKY